MELAGYPQAEAAFESRGMNPPDRAYLAAMAEAVQTQDHGGVNASGSAASPSQKRKRGLPEPSSPTDPRRPKRGAASHNDVDSAAYVESAVEAAQAAAAASVNVDLTALQQATADHHDSGSAANASTTAAAALGYPTLHIPPSTEETFAAQMAAEDQAAHHDHSFGGDVPDGLPDSSNLVSQNGARGSDSHSKPAVGSEEWHKVRKDNHKEGELGLLGHFSLAGIPANKQLSRASPS
jgi:transcriptional regulator CBF1